jgi:hypothetical protein
VLDPLAEKHRRKDLLDVQGLLSVLAESGNGTAEQIAAFVGRAGRAGIGTDNLLARTGLRPEVLAKLLSELSAAGRIVNADDRCVSN